jgi:hypothetical protein
LERARRRAGTRATLIQKIIEDVYKYISDGNSVFMVEMGRSGDTRVWNRARDYAFSDFHPQKAEQSWILDHFREAYKGVATVEWAVRLSNGTGAYGYRFDFGDNLEKETKSH